MKYIKYSIIVLFVLLTNTITQAQIRDFGYFMTTGAEDAQELFEAYITPYVNGFGASLTGGWYNTAKTHKLGGFDITLSSNCAIVPEEDRTFLVSDLELNNLQPVAGSAERSPSIAGERESGPALEYSYEGYSAEAFNLPAGTAIPYTPAPVINVGVGLIKGTELMGRYVPTLGTKKGKFGLWGVGLKHDVKQWIPGLSKVPVLNISVMGAYTKLNTWVALDVTPERINLENYIDAAPETWDGQKMELSVGSFTTNILISADLPIISFYGGAGVAITNSNLLLKGDYPMITGIELDGPVVEAQNNPIDIKIKNKDGGITKPRLNAGIRIKLAAITLHTDYTWADYSVFSGGLGISIR